MHFREIFSQKETQNPLPYLSVNRHRLISNKYKPGERRQGDLPRMNVQQEACVVKTVPSFRGEKQECSSG